MPANGGSEKEGAIFSGMCFFLFGFDPVSESQYRSEISLRGGVNVGMYDKSRCTHVVVSGRVYDDPFCVVAREDRMTLVTESWIEDCVDFGTIADAGSILYKPLKDLNGIPGCGTMYICLTGYQRQERDDIMDTIKRFVMAGNGTILATSPPYTRFLNSEIDLAIISSGIPRVDLWVQEFIRHEIPCVLADYLVDYICKPGHSLDRHVLFNTHEWATKSFEKITIRSGEIISCDSSDEMLSEDENDIRCVVCERHDRGEVMLICGDEEGSVGCGIGTHIDCCVPPFESVPKEDWFCQKCSERKSTTFSKVKKRRKKLTKKCR